MSGVSLKDYLYHVCRIDVILCSDTLEDTELRKSLYR